MTETEFIAKLTAIRQMAQRLNLDFDQMLAEVLRRFPPDSIKIIRAKLELAELDAQLRN
jgi:DNA-binding transcriptional regulator YiaG